MLPVLTHHEAKAQATLNWLPRIVFSSFFISKNEPNQNTYIDVFIGFSCISS